MSKFAIPTGSYLNVTKKKIKKANHMCAILLKAVKTTLF